MWTAIFFILFFLVWPIWLFIKLAKCGKGILRPNFERMNREINKGGIQYNGFFAYNRPGGKLFYYITMLYVFALFFIAIYFIIYSLAK